MEAVPSAIMARASEAQAQSQPLTRPVPRAPEPLTWLPPASIACSCPFLLRSSECAPRTSPAPRIERRSGRYRSTRVHFGRSEWLVDFTPVTSETRVTAFEAANRRYRFWGQVVRFLRHDRQPSSRADGSQPEECRSMLGACDRARPFSFARATTHPPMRAQPGRRRFR